MRKINDISFFEQDTILLAQALIGKWIVTNINGKQTVAQISETEAYLGINDSACHTYQAKRTQRTEPMWQNGGTIYIYLCYGMHNMLNIVSNKKDIPEAVLIRAVIGGEGPAKATKLLNIDRSLNGQQIVNNPQIAICDDGNEYNFIAKPRVGINYALANDRDALLRFVLKK